jgi:hypothetical protein
MEDEEWEKKEVKGDGGWRMGWTGLHLIIITSEHHFFFVSSVFRLQQQQSKSSSLLSNRLA